MQHAGWKAGVTGVIKKPFRITRNGVLQPGTLRGLGRKGFAAATGLAGIGIGDFETAAGQAIAKIDYRSAEVLSAERVDEYRHAMHFRRQIIVPSFIEGHRILHAGTPALLYVDPEELAQVFRLV